MNNKQTLPGKQSDISSACSIACGMLTQDCAWLIPLYAILIAPQLLATFITGDDPQMTLLFLIAGRMTDLLFLALVGIIWMRRLAIKPTHLRLSAIIPVVAVGMGLWLLFMFPLAMQFIPLEASTKLLLLILLAPALLINLQYFFYFIPLLFGVTSNREAIKIAKEYTNQDPLLALKVVIGPAALTVLLANVINSFSPDQSSLLVATLIDFSGGLFWLFTTYIALAYGLLKLPDALWHTNGLDPYRNARFTTLAMRSSQWFATFLSPKKALFILFLSALVWAGNFLRLAQMPPTAKLAVESIEAFDHSLALELDAVDEKHNFRGFRPIFFALAGPQRGLISKWPERVSSVGLSGDFKIAVPLRPSMKLRLEFLTQRSAEDLLKLEDLYLWYRNVKIEKLDMKKAKLISKR